ncbi:hypothetical protein IMAU80174_02203 [Lactiplantibacillus plantarum]|uniref:Uncharacterized protein n=1 Tax=Lactiplantibacillus plantarum subsp. plantarum TaxID=337330 RepID=A0A2S3U4A5_LACPN|nr:hypothetical protein [Lactiplantibacillus plantarum]MCG0693613.1 hypothetical protein [Lactiplantibacillus plantarum]POD83110.1 hypothetical protein S101258_02109 [Lactiplantibacillus plantarum subsp. plantarum]
MNERTKKSPCYSPKYHTDSLKTLLLWAFCILILLQNEE